MEGLQIRSNGSKWDKKAPDLHRGLINNLLLNSSYLKNCGSCST